MESLHLRQDVGLIFIVTPLLKQRLLEELDAAIEEVSRQIDQFDFRARHALAELQRADLNRAMAARQQIESEKRRLDAIKHELQERKAETESLQIDEEYPRGTLEGQVVVNVGDNLFEKLAGVQIVVKDGLVQQFRTQPMSPEDIILPSPRSANPGE